MEEEAAEKVLQRSQSYINNFVGKRKGSMGEIIRLVDLKKPDSNPAKAGC